MLGLQPATEHWQLCACLQSYRATSAQNLVPVLCHGRPLKIARSSLHPCGAWHDGSLACLTRLCIRVRDKHRAGVGQERCSYPGLGSALNPENPRPLNNSAATLGCMLRKVAATRLRRDRGVFPASAASPLPPVAVVVSMLTVQYILAQDVVTLLGVQQSGLCGTVASDVLMLQAHL